MEKLINTIKLIELNKDCLVIRSILTNNLLFENELPSDLKYYLENFESIILFKNKLFSIKIVGYSDFLRANPIIVGEDIENDLSHNWFIIAYDQSSQYITIDLSADRLGYCYDSFWDRHGLVGEQPIIAKSFTELLEKLYLSNGDIWYWLKNDFKSYGDAYDNI